jgi:hypothetical protein
MRSGGAIVLQLYLLGRAQTGHRRDSLVKDLDVCLGHTRRSTTMIDERARSDGCNHSRQVIAACFGGGRKRPGPTGRVEWTQLAQLLHDAD